MRIYIVGIAGAGVSALASILVSEGHEVTGSDEACFPPVSTYLDRLGVRYETHFAAANVPDDVDLAIVGTSAKLDAAQNPEIAALHRRGVPCYSFAEYLGLHTRERENLLVAGSFGKSTLTALIAYLLKASGRDPGWFIGAVPLDLDRTGQAGVDPLMIIESDEYVVSPQDRRSKFELYRPAHTLISSLIHDHVNMFPTMADYVAPFARLIASTPAEGLLVCARGFPALTGIVGDRRAVWYGRTPGEGYFARAIEIGERTRFEIVRPDGGSFPVETELLGLHNIENLVGAAAFLLERGLLAPEEIAAAAPGFRGVARRLDKKTRTSRIPIYEGFGSSYEKARSAIEAIRLHFPARPLVVVFEPHTFSWRNEDAIGWYDTVFEGAAGVLLLPPPGHGAAGHKQLDQATIAARIAATGAPVKTAANGEAALAALLAACTGDEVVLLLSSGPLDGLAETAPAAFEARFG